MPKTRSAVVAAIAFCGVSLIVSVAAQADDNAATSASLEAQLIDKDKNAQKQTATVKVSVKGIELVDPAAVGERPNKGQGHLHYQVDNGPVVATTTMKLSFHDLSAGDHRIVVMLVGNDHQPLGPQATLTLSIPAKSAGNR